MDLLTSYKKWKKYTKGDDDMQLREGQLIKLAQKNGHDWEVDLYVGNTYMVHWDDDLKYYIFDAAGDKVELYWHTIHQFEVIE